MSLKKWLAWGRSELDGQEVSKGFIDLMKRTPGNTKGVMMVMDGQGKMYYSGNVPKNELDSFIRMFRKGKFQ